MCRCSCQNSRDCQHRRSVGDRPDVDNFLMETAAHKYELNSGFVSEVLHKNFEFDWENEVPGDITFNQE